MPITQKDMLTLVGYLAMLDQMADELLVKNDRSRIEQLKTLTAQYLRDARMVATGAPLVYDPITTDPKHPDLPF